MLEQKYCVWDKALFGTDYPFTTVQAALDGLRGMNCLVEGMNLPRLAPESIERVIDRDSLGLLG